jgi:hypothetical protein
MTHKDLRAARFAVGAAALLILVLTAVALAEPGGKDDPLITLKYAQQLSSFTLRKLPADQPLRLRSGAELVIVSPQDAPVNAAGLTKSTPVFNLSSGEQVIVSALRAGQHYVHAGSGELALRFDRDVTCLVRGELK